MGRKRSTNCMKVTIHISDKSERINATAAKTRNAQQAVGAPEQAWSTGCVWPRPASSLGMQGILLRRLADYE